MIIWSPGVKMKDVEIQIIQMALNYYQGNKTQAAASLGISAKTLYNKLAEFEKKNAAKGTAANPDKH